MKLVDSKVSILPQEPGVVGMLKLIERAGRTAYMSLDKITDDSYKKFIGMLYNKGHWAVFNLGTVYLKVPIEDFNKVSDLFETTPWTVYEEEVNGFYYITTNYRVICQLEYDEIMEKYWCEPEEHHYRRITTHWICSRVIAQQILRHRILCPVMESTRYVNYSKERFGTEITFIIPQWVYDLRDELSETIDPLTKADRSWIKTLKGEELWKTLCCMDRTVSSRDKFLKLAEQEYIYEATTDEGYRLPAEDARGVLPLDTKTEICITGYVKDWYYESPENSPEKAGFFKLRCAPDAQSDVKVLAESLKNQFKEKGIDKLK